MIQQNSVKWTVSLSNGETVYEDKGDYKILVGELSPYQRLLKYLEENREVFITSLSLFTDDNKRWNLPSAGRNPKFKVFDDAEKPKSYKFFRRIGLDMDFGSGNRKEEIFAVIEATYPSKKLQIWVSEDNPDICWSVII